MGRFKRLIGFPIAVKPIIDFREYKTNNSSFSGNSLSGSNILLVCSDDMNGKLFKDFFEAEGCKVCQCEFNEAQILGSGIHTLSNDFIGPFQHIINYLDIDNGYDSVVGDSFSIFQAEADYMVENNMCGSICTAIRYSDSARDITVSNVSAVKSLVAGLGSVLPSHLVVSNGVVADTKVPIKAITHTVSYLCSKYGYCLTGEILEMKGKM